MTVRLFRLSCLAVMLVTLCLGCGTVTPMATVPDAENALVTRDGRVFVSGSLNLYEITRNENGDFLRHTLVDGDFYFTGIGEYMGYLYTVKNSPGIRVLTRPDPELVIAPISGINPFDGPKNVDELGVTLVLPGLGMPNGLAIDEQGRLFSADTRQGKIFRFDIDATEPTRVSGPFDSGLEGLESPNGMAIDAGVLYFTDGKDVKKSVISAEGVLLPSVTLYTARTVLDDLMVYQGHLLVCNYMKGTLVCLSPDGGVLYETPAETFAFPSSVHAADGPMFGPDSLIVTEKGMIYDSRSSFGNRVVLVEMMEEL